MTRTERAPFPKEKTLLKRRKDPKPQNGGGGVFPLAFHPKGTKGHTLFGGYHLFGFKGTPTPYVGFLSDLSPWALGDWPKEGSSLRSFAVLSG